MNQTPDLAITLVAHASFRGLPYLSAEVIMSIRLYFV